MKIFAFDRDKTVTTNKGPVPIEWVEQLAQCHEVWAIGNQMIKKEVDIPGFAEIRAHFDGTPTLYPRPRRLELLQQIVPDATEYLVVDDEDLSMVEGWLHYFPQEFVDNAHRYGLEPTDSSASD